jgi:hypothetical protein
MAMLLPETVYGTLRKGIHGFFFATREERLEISSHFLGKDKNCRWQWQKCIAASSLPDSVVSFRSG